VLLCLLPAVWKNAGAKSFAAIATLLGATFLLMLFGKLKTAAGFFSDGQIWIPVAGILVLVIIALSLPQFPSSKNELPAPLLLPSLVQVGAQGWIALLSLFLANALWMVVDISTWQRIASVKPENNNFPLQALRRGTRRVAYESPATWCLGVVLGWSISAAGILPPGKDPSEGIPSVAAALAAGALPPFPPYWVSCALYPALLVACISIMLSTVNALISTIAFTAYHDLAGAPTRTNGGTSQRLAPAQRWTVGLVLCGLILYPVVRYGLGAQLPTVLYTAYSAQLSLFTITLLALFRKGLDGTAAITSLCVGIIFAALGGLLATQSSDPSLSVMPPVFALVGSAAAYFVLYARRKRSLAEAEGEG